MHLFVVATALVAAAPVTAGGRPGSSVAAGELPTDQIVIRLAAGKSFDAVTLGASGGVDLKLVRRLTDGSYVVKLPNRRAIGLVRAITNRLAARGDVVLAEPDAMMQPLATPTDPSWPLQWDMFAPVGGSYGADLPGAWDITTGSAGVTVGVIDTGYRPHVDLAGRFVAGYDFIGDTLVANDGNGRDSDASDPGDWITSAENQSGYFVGCGVNGSSWHGTHVSGTIGADPNNALGVAGINWVSKIQPLRVLGKCGGYTTDIADAIRWGAGLPVAGLPANATPSDVLNLSLGGSGACSATYQSAIDAAVAAGTVVVAAAGNDSKDAADSSPASCNDVIAVAATGPTGNRAYYSNYGTTVEIAAPGGDSQLGKTILSTLNAGTTTPGADAYANYQGTSMATPHVVGVVSLMLSVNPSLTPAQVTSMLQSTATPFPAGSTCTTSTCGAGIVDATAAVNAAAAAAPAAAPVNTGLPTVVGVAQVGQVLTGTVGSWSGTAPIGFSQQWQRCSGASCAAITAATALSYTPVAADLGFTLRLRVSASNTVGGPVTADSAATAVVVAAAGGGSTVSDAFTRADALTLGPGWSTTTRYGSSSCLLAISANQAAFPAGRSGGCEQYWTANPTQTDGVGSFTVTALPPEGGEVDVEGRMQALGSSQAVLYEGAWLRHTAGPDTYYIVRRNSNGSWVTLVTINGPDMAVGDQFAFKLAGSSLSLHRKPAGAGSWAQVVTTSDTTISGPGRFGLEFYNASGAKADDWTISTDLPGSSTAAAPVNTGLPTVVGVAQVGQVLTGTVGSWSGTAPIGFSQQWQRCSGASCAAITAATALSYTPVAADLGFTLRLRVSASNTVGGPVTADSAATAVVVAAATAPVNTGLPTVVGVAQVGQVLTGTVGSWSGTAPIGFSQQWQRCSGASCAAITAATALSYTPVAADLGFTLRLRVSASNTVGGPVTADSAATAVVVAAAGGGSTVSDAFTRADALTLGPGWSTTTRYGSSSCLLAISANQAAFPAGRSGGCEQYWTANPTQTDGVGSFTVTALPPEGGEVDVEGRMQALGSSQAVLYEGAWLRHTAGPDTYYIVRRNSNGSWVTLVTINGPDMAVGDQFAFKLAGSSLSLHRKPAGAGSWAQVVTTSDTTISGPGRFGLEFYNASGAKADDWTISTDLPG